MQEKPDVAYSDIGGMDIQKQEVKEAVELPLTHFELYKQIGIDPPRGQNDLVRQQTVRLALVIAAKWSGSRVLRALQADRHRPTKRLVRPMMTWGGAYDLVGHTRTRLGIIYGGQMVQLTHFELYKQIGVDPPRG
jgi:ATP-dependent 26S proteasome regulatory subunit